MDKFVAALSCGGGSKPTLGLNIGTNTSFPCSSPTQAASMCYICDAPTGLGLDLIDFTCNPFSFHFRSNGLVDVGHQVDCPKVTTVLGNTDFYVYDSDSTTCATDATIKVTGCNGVPLSGASVTVKTSGGTTVASGTSDGSGNFSFAGGLANATVVIAASRFGSQTWTGQTLLINATVIYDQTLQTDGFTNNISAGYQCFSGGGANCGYPVANTLHCTWSIAGAQTFTWSAPFWTSSFSFGGHAYVVKIDATGAMSVTRDGISGGTITFALTSCPLSFAGTITPTGTVLGELGTGALTE
jgi:hypothetical protein